MRYVHISKTYRIVDDAIVASPGVTMNLGRNKKKREMRQGKPRKHWPSLARGYGYE